MVAKSRRQTGFRKSKFAFVTFKYDALRNFFALNNGFVGLSVNLASFKGE
jgi:hypothetical protein